MSNTSWWRLALAAPAIVPEFALVSRHVCDMPARDDVRRVNPCLNLLAAELPLFPAACRRRGADVFWGGRKRERDKGIDGLGHFGRAIAEAIAARRGERLPPRFFGESASVFGVYLRDVAGLGDGFNPSLYCHQRGTVKQDFEATHEEGCVEGADAFRAYLAARYPTGDALFRDHFECYASPPFDAWFGFDALPPAGDAAWDRRAVAETYASLDRGAFAGGCGAAAGDVRLVIHARLGDLLATAGPAEGRRLRNALVVAATLAARLRGRVHVLVLSDSPAAAVAGVLEGDVRVELGDARSDGVSHLVDGRTVGLENDVELTFLGAGNPLVAIHCMATADVLLGPEACGEPWAPRRRLGRKRWKGASAKLAQNRADFAGVSDERCSSVVAFARQLAAGDAAFRGLPAAPLNATSVDAGLDAFLARGLPGAPLRRA